MNAVISILANITTGVFVPMLTGSKRTPKSALRFVSPERAVKVLAPFAHDGVLYVTLTAADLKKHATAQDGKANLAAVASAYKMKHVKYEGRSVYAKALGNGATLYGFAKDASETAQPVTVSKRVYTAEDVKAMLKANGARRVTEAQVTTMLTMLNA